MSALSALERNLAERLLVLDAAPAAHAERTPTAEALEESLSEFFRVASLDEQQRAAVVLLNFARGLEDAITPKRPGETEAVSKDAAPISAEGTAPSEGA